MHEFLPKSDIEMTDLANVIGVTPGLCSRNAYSRLSESNPMLGHRGVQAWIKLSRNLRNASRGNS